MRRHTIAVVLGLAAVAAGCGGVADATNRGGPTSTTISTQPDRLCIRPVRSETFVTRETGGFSPHSTLVVRTDGFAWASAGPAFGGPRCYRVSTEELADLRAALEAAGLRTLDPSYAGSMAGPEGMVIEIDTYTVTADGVTVSADSSAHIPSRFSALLERLSRIEGLVVARGAAPSR
jgi:hypothetical protein